MGCKYLSLSRGFMADQPIWLMFLRGRWQLVDVYHNRVRVRAQPFLRQRLQLYWI